MLCLYKRDSFFPTAARCRKKGKGSSDTSMLPRGQFVMLLLCGSSFFYQHFINQILFTLYMYNIYFRFTNSYDFL